MILTGSSRDLLFWAGFLSPPQIRSHDGVVSSDSGGNSQLLLDASFRLSLMWLKDNEISSPRRPQQANGSPTSMRRRSFLRSPLHHPVFLLLRSSSFHFPYFRFRTLHHLLTITDSLHLADNANRKVNILRPEDIQILSEFQSSVQQCVVCLLSLSLSLYLFDC